MRIGGLVVGLVVAASALLTACQPANSSPSAAVQQSGSAAKTPRPLATPVPTPTAAPALAVAKVGAVATPSGFTAFAVIDNPSGQTAMDVKIQISAVGPGGQVLTRRSGGIHRIGAGQRDAVAVPFPVGRTLPTQFVASVPSVRWSADDTTDVAQVAAADFLQDARMPGVRVHLVSHAQRAIPVSVTAVCWDSAGNIRGGGTRTVMVGPDAQGHDSTIAVAVSAVPTRCDAYAVTTS
jgi:hypothetical protein